jgi:hypothetical protein
VSPTEWARVKEMEERSSGDLQKLARLMQFPRVDVATSGFQVEVTEQGSADVDGQTAVDQFRGEQAPEIVWCEGNTGELRVGGGEVGAAALQHGCGHAVGQHGAGGAKLSLEQERHRRGCGSCRVGRTG